MGGRLKRRPDDFCVGEIDTTGRILEILPFQTTHEKREITGEYSRYIRFVVQKMGLSTFDVVNIIAASLHLPRQMVGYAGLKDKRAITAQFMSVPSRAGDALQTVQLSRIAIRDPHYVRRPVQIGDLWGNQFKILLRDPDRDPTEIWHSLVSLGDSPILNYFGVQRFGVSRPQTHLVGKHLIKKDYGAAIRTIISTPGQHEPAELADARREFAESMQPTPELFANLPEDLRYERDVLSYLDTHPGQFKEAFQRIPPKVQTLFIHSYQSYLFNRLISMRIRDGMSIETPEIGDFLIQLDTSHSGRDSWLYVTEKKHDEYTMLVHNNEYGIAAPVPGFATKLPPCRQTEHLRSILAQEGVSLSDFLNRGNRYISSPGGLHLVAIRPLDYSVQYHDGILEFIFKLRKGSYATIVMREIMKNHPLNRI